MIFSTLLVTLVSLATLTEPVSASLRITVDHHSFGGVNYPQLQFFAPEHRDNTIKEIIKSGARVIRLFIRPDDLHPDPEPELGSFDRSLLDQFDDTLAAIHHLSKGQMKVIIAPHDAHALRGSNDVPCDAYCKDLGGYFLDFYSSDKYRELYKTRLEVFFKHYPSKNFDGRPWGTLSEVILGVDIQNQPFSGIFPIPAGESWICDMASHLKFTLGLDASSIAVISGGVSGAQKPDEWQNFPDSVFDCKAIDIIGIHGYFSKQHDATAGTPWANMFVPGNTLTGRAKGKKKGDGKLLLVEEWSYVHNDDFGLFYKQEALFDQGNALNYRGIPWLYSHLTTIEEGKTARINPIQPSYTSWTALKQVLKAAQTARSNFNWSTYLPPPFSIKPLTEDEKTAQKLRSMLTNSNTQEFAIQRLGLSNITSIPLNPFVLEQSDCTFGCEGHLCDAQDGCLPHLFCKNSICTNDSTQPGKIGDMCTSKTPCQPHLLCSAGKCQSCTARPTIQPPAQKRKRSIPNEPLPLPSQQEYEAQHRGPILSHALTGTCHTDALPSLFASLRPRIALSSSNPPPPICLPPSHHAAPCTSPSHCSADEYCNWGSCAACTSADACLGSSCRSNNKCKTGYCNDHGRCDYSSARIKKNLGPGGAKMGKGKRIPGVPRGHESGPARVRDEAMRIVIPEEGVMNTAAAAAAMGKA
ncbi:glycoside hydrolase family 5 protein [Bipolaris zeicola 26-R-13]|uniref:Glycoside hydrolase family 5 protein n=1 Tax=Cochliobolus carbonum (strain 26-R-13) TaxID=930089 RepID=W6XXJ3_COCC2|nr:glycoside hydrolase family 5 protein [Bipolaris zeicola 26-R-13]EUC30483.1 glycoside hydrolase family 5 protein [Bipolaris zeicola 26-R-13]